MSLILVDAMSRVVFVPAAKTSLTPANLIKETYMVLKHTNIAKKKQVEVFKSNIFAIVECFYGNSISILVIFLSYQKF